jgi:uncharacterized protein YdeI (YjbR/CyaY-like superfamily)
MRTDITPDQWYDEREQWQDEARLLRALVCSTGLDESVKWGQPAYSHQGKTVLLVSHRKVGATVSFFKGALFDDPDGVLVSPGKNSRHARYLQYTSVAEVEGRRDELLGFIAQAKAVQEAGLKVEPATPEESRVPELVEHMRANPAFRAAFEALTPGRQRAYILHFDGAKRAQTRRDRIARFEERILAGKGMHDCVCGHSKRMPRCDGSHKHLA